MRIIGMMRVRNEARWIARALASILAICDRVLVLDDHSDDGTPELCSSIPGVDVIDSRFCGLDETRDKNFLLEQLRGQADWIVCIDGDEMLAPGGAAKLRAAMSGDAHSISMRIPYLWDSETEIRMDGVYGEFRRHSAFRPMDYIYASSTAGGFHCGNVPARALLKAVTIDARLLHFGYMHSADRERKYAWYNAMDPNNRVEDCYRHIAAGLATPHGDLLAMQKQIRLSAGLPDLRDFELIPPAPAASEKTRHGGPIRLEVVA